MREIVKCETKIRRLFRGLNSSSQLSMRILRTSSEIKQKLLEITKFCKKIIKIQKNLHYVHIKHLKLW